MKQRQSRKRRSSSAEELARADEVFQRFQSAISHIREQLFPTGSGEDKQIAALLEQFASTSDALLQSYQNRIQEIDVLEQRFHELVLRQNLYEALCNRRIEAAEEQLGIALQRWIRKLVVELNNQ